MTTHDLLIRGAQVVRPGDDAPRRLDVAVTDGRFSAVEEAVDPATATTVVEASGRHLFPGVVDAHQHWGIYNPLEEDTETESRASAQAATLYVVWVSKESTGCDPAIRRVPPRSGWTAAWSPSASCTATQSP